MAVIALTSGMGTGVKYVAEIVARQLGVELVHREICVPGADRLPAATKVRHAPWGSRWEAGLAWLEASRAEEGLAHLEEVCRMAQRGNVLIWGITPLHFLSAATQVTKIRVRTTMALRVRRIMSCMGTDEPDSALEKILQNDRHHADTLRRMFGVDDFETPSLYDAVIDTGREPAETCAMQIVKLASAPDKKMVAASKATFDVMIEQIQTLRRHIDRLLVSAN